MNTAIDPRRKELESTAVDRFNIWVKGGSKYETGLSGADYERKYIARYYLDCGIWGQKGQLTAFQIHEKTVFCPQCQKFDAPRGVVAMSRLFITVGDDPMTTFKALARFVCQHCMFEEYHPLTADPRQVPTDRDRFEEQVRKIQDSMAKQSPPFRMPPPYDMSGITPYGIGGATRDEQEALYRAYQLTGKKL